MNKYQEALITLTDWFHSYTDKNGITIQERHITPAYVKAKKNIQELVDKETPKKLVRYTHSNEWHCTTCGSGNGEYEGTVGTHNYCHYCGQKLDWSNTYE